MIHCEICNEKMNVITWKHLLKHGITLREYKKLFPLSPIKSPESIERKSKSVARANSSRKGIPRSQETIKKIKTTKALNPRQAWNKGIQLSEEQKKLLSSIRKEKINNGEIIHWNLGNTTPSEVKQKIRQTALSQHRIYSEQSKEKRFITLKEKYSNGWVHPSTLRKGISLNLSEKSRNQIKEGASIATSHRKKNREKRLNEHLLQYNIEVNHISDDGYIVNMTCKNCGTVFSRTASVLVPFRYNLYNGEYCPSCFPPMWGFYSFNFFEKNPEFKNQPGILYFSLMESTEEKFLKVGVTTRGAYARLLGEPYNFVIIFELEMSIYQAFLIEQFVLSNIKKYQPLIKFGGSSECISLNSYNSVIELIDEIMLKMNIPIKIVTTSVYI